MPSFLINIVAFTVLTVLWLGFAAALLFRPAALDSAWQAFRSLPQAAQVVIGLLVLPVALGLWIWESNWPPWLRLLLVAGLAVATAYTFLPRRR